MTTLLSAQSNASAVSDLREWSEEQVVERDRAEARAKVLRETGGSKAKAARRLGLTRTQLYGRLASYSVANAEA